MKNFVILCILLISMSCNNSNNKKTDIDKSSTTVAETPSLGPVIERTYAGIIPTTNGSSMYYRLTLKNQKHSGNGNYILTQINTEKENKRIDSEGKWGTLRGIEEDPNATIYQLNIGDTTKYVNFLYMTDSLIMLNNTKTHFHPHSDYTLRLVDND